MLQGAVSQETKRILMKKPEDRTEAEVKHVNKRNVTRHHDKPLKYFDAFPGASGVAELPSHRGVPTRHDQGDGAASVAGEVRTEAHHRAADAPRTVLLRHPVRIG